MLLQKLNLLKKTFSTSTQSLNWRNQIKQTQLASQLSSILLQRKNWIPLLHSFNLNLKLTQPLFHQIILQTQNNPQISLSFFNWVKSNFGFQPSLKSLCKLIQISIQSGLSKPVIPILDSLVQTLPVSIIVESTTQVCANSDSHGLVLSFVIQRYSYKGLCLEGLNVFNEVKLQGYVVTIQACNALLGALYQQNEIRLSWCFYASMIRNGVSPDRSTWSIIARILSKNGKLESIVTLLDSGVCRDTVIFNLVVEGYCKRGNFKAAFEKLNESCNQKFNSRFSTYSSILDGACIYQDVKVIETALVLMVDKNLLPNSFSSEYDSIIQKFCDAEKTYASELFLKKAYDENIELQDATYGCMLKALSKGGRLKEAICLYGKISRTGIAVNDCVCYAFVNLLCKEYQQTEEVTELLIEMIRKGFLPHASELSKLFHLQCNRRRWRQAEDLMNAILEKGSFPNLICCSSLIEHYCYTKKVDLAMALHTKIEKVKCGLDVKSYNVLLKGLFADRKVEAANSLFDYMRKLSVVNSESFTTMINGLCQEKELRKAMKLHDEMMKLKHKPDEITYKRLILGFNQ